MFLGYGNPNSSSLVEFSRSTDAFCSYSANVTSLPAYTATVLGPILYNGAQPPGQSGVYPERKAIIIGISVSLTTASGADVAVGLAWGSQLTGNPVQNTPIAATTAATLTSATYCGNKQPAMQSYSAGTVASAATGFLPLVSLPTTAITAASGIGFMDPD